VERRKHFRFPAAIPMTISSSDGIIKVMVKTENIGLGGVDFWTEQHVKMLEFVELTLELGESGEVIKHKGQVVRCIDFTSLWKRLFSRKKKYSCAIQFEKFEPETQSKLISFLKDFV
jgi:hypothetical protein